MLVRNARNTRMYMIYGLIFSLCSPAPSGSTYDSGGSVDDLPWGAAKFSVIEDVALMPHSRMWKSLPECIAYDARVCLTRVRHLQQEQNCAWTHSLWQEPTTRGAGCERDSKVGG
ncbi:hypothetical protein BD309DRAFT_631429 [Dichomitus squalens]|nr:hypothetical protein BD309DRAFT_631429 [Dichomitus squalens]